MLSYIAPALLYAIIGGGIVAAFCRVGGDAQARDDAAHDAANAVRLAEAPAPQNLPVHVDGVIDA